MKCAVHLDRQALGYCSRCGKPLCKECLVRLRVGNFCDACANAPEGRPARLRRGMPWRQHWIVPVGSIAPSTGEVSVLDACSTRLPFTRMRAT